MRVYLNVPYYDIELAKQKGCRYDKIYKKWYIENAVNLDNYLKQWKIENHLMKPTTSGPLKHPPFKVTAPRSKRKK